MVSNIIFCKTFHRSFESIMIIFILNADHSEAEASLSGDTLEYTVPLDILEYMQMVNIM